MTHDVFAALTLYALASSITPGPNNMMLLASGANFGFRRTIPHMLGISLGHCFLIVMVGIGLISLFERFPVLHVVLKVAAVIYMGWLAWKIATASAPNGRETGSRPLTFLQAAAFQWVNPKGWAMALTAITLYVTDHSFTGIALVAIAFSLVNLPSVSAWTLLGREMRRFLTSPSRLRTFNYTMAAALILSVLPVILAKPA